MKADVEALSRIDWQLFCTFTFSRDRMPLAKRQSMFVALVRSKAAASRSSFSKVLWCLRSEFGEMTARHHYHALIGGLPLSANNPRGCRIVESIWKSLGGGFAVVRPFSPELNGVDYILKGMSEVVSNITSANMYELGKFGKGTEPTLSTSTIRAIKARGEHKGQTVRSAQRKAEYGSTASRLGASLFASGTTGENLPGVFHTPIDCQQSDVLA